MALATADRLRAAIERNVFLLRRSEKRVTASFGVSSFPEDGKSPQDLLLAADRSLYEAKRSGRNRVCGNI
jgi:diguanylate cyclase (GGDEF)-like protein